MRVSEVIILYVPNTAIFVAYILLGAMDQRKRKPDTVCAIASTEKVKYSCTKAKLFRKLRLVTYRIIMSTFGLNDL